MKSFDNLENSEISEASEASDNTATSHDECPKEIENIENGEVIDNTEVVENNATVEGGEVIENAELSQNDETTESNEAVENAEEVENTEDVSDHGEVASDAEAQSTEADSAENENISQDGRENKGNEDDDGSFDKIMKLVRERKTEDAEADESEVPHDNTDDDGFGLDGFVTVYKEEDNEAREGTEVKGEAGDGSESDKAAEKPEEKKEKKNKSGFAGFLFDFTEMAALAVAIVMLVVTFLIRYSPVSGQSMTHTIYSDDLVLVRIIGYTPVRNDIVIFQAPDHGLERPLIKRVIAIGGDKLEIDFKNWSVKVNGVELQEDYIRINRALNEEENQKLREDLKNGIIPSEIMNPESIADVEGGSFDAQTFVFTATVPEGKIFAMGDNRQNSRDSRSSDIGFIDERFVIGKAFWRISPIESFGALE